MFSLLETILRDDSGQDLVEYTLLIVLLALAVVTALEFLGGAITSGVQDAGSDMQAASGSSN